MSASVVASEASKPLSPELVVVAPLCFDPRNGEPGRSVVPSCIEFRAALDTESNEPVDVVEDAAHDAETKRGVILILFVLRASNVSDGTDRGIVWHFDGLVFFAALDDMLLFGGQTSTELEREQLVHQTLPNRYSVVA